MIIRLLESARRELDEAVEWYNSQAPGLGDAFLIEVINALDRIARHPEAWKPLSVNTRRCRMKRFPYGIIYAIEPAELLVIALAHNHRFPGYWTGRR